MYPQELGPALPVGSPSLINQNDRNDSRLSGLHQCQTFKSFVHRPKPAGKEGDCVGLFYEIHFPSEKVIEIDQLRIPVDDLIRFLLERQPDVQSEAVLPAGASLGGSHNPVTTSRDDHKSVLTHFLRKTFCS